MKLPSLFTTLIMACLLAPFATAQDKPNLILILCDDLGYADIGVQGARHPTPAIDRMAAEGVRFTSFYTAANVCTPTRASIMTGCYPKRVGLHENELRNWVLFPGNKRGINPGEITIAELLKQRGYATAIFGKWHLGDQPPFLPTRHGFDEYFGIPYSNDMGRTDRPADLYPPLPLLRNEKVVEAEPDQRLLTRRLTEATLDFIRRNKANPFFVYLPHPMPHWPMYASENFAGKSGNAAFGDAVTEIDWSVNQILSTLKQLNLDEKTLVVFTSDNGGHLKFGANNTPLRGMKASTWEGGQRVPFVARWPGRIPAGKVSPEIAVTFDLYTTFAKLGGAQVPTDRIVDGRDIWPLLSAKPGAASPHDAFFFFHHGTIAAVRSGPWKLFVRHQIAPQGRPDQKRTVEPALYNLDADLAETTDVSAQHPDVVARLQALVERCSADLGSGDRPGEVADAQPLIPRNAPTPVR